MTAFKSYDLADLGVTPYLTVVSAPGETVIALPASIPDLDLERTIELPGGPLWALENEGTGHPSIRDGSYGLTLDGVSDVRIHRPANCASGNSQRLHGRLWVSEAEAGSPNEWLVRRRYRFDFSASGARSSSVPSATLYTGNAIADPNKCVAFITGVASDSVQTDYWNRTLAVPSVDPSTGAVTIETGGDYSNNCSVFVTLVEFVGSNWSCHYFKKAGSAVKTEMAIGTTQWATGVTHNDGEYYWNDDPREGLPSGTLEYCWRRVGTAVTAATFLEDLPNYERIGPRDWSTEFDLKDQADGSGASSTVSDWAKAIAFNWMSYPDETGEFRDHQNLNPGQTTPSGIAGKCAFRWNFDDGQNEIYDAATFYGVVLENSDSNFNVERRNIFSGVLAQDFEDANPDHDNSEEAVVDLSEILDDLSVSGIEFALVTHGQTAKQHRDVSAPGHFKKLYSFDSGSFGLSSRRAALVENFFLSVQIASLENTSVAGSAGSTASVSAFDGTVTLAVPVGVLSGPITSFTVNGDTVVVDGGATATGATYAIDHEADFVRGGALSHIRPGVTYKATCTDGTTTTDDFDFTVPAPSFGTYLLARRGRAQVEASGGQSLATLAYSNSALNDMQPSDPFLVESVGTMVVNQDAVPYLISDLDSFEFRFFDVSEGEWSSLYADDLTDPGDYPDIEADIVVDPPNSPQTPHSVAETVQTPAGGLTRDSFGHIRPSSLGVTITEQITGVLGERIRAAHARVASVSDSDTALCYLELTSTGERIAARYGIANLTIQYYPADGEIVDPFVAGMIGIDLASSPLGRDLIEGDWVTLRYDDGDGVTPETQLWTMLVNGTNILPVGPAGQYVSPPAGQGIRPDAGGGFYVSGNVNGAKLDQIGVDGVLEDVTPPVVEVAQPDVEVSANSGVLDLALGFTDESPFTISIEIDGSAVLPGGFTWNTQQNRLEWLNIPAGVYAIDRIATDAAGNPSTTDSFVFTAHVPLEIKVPFTETELAPRVWAVSQAATIDWGEIFNLTESSSSMLEVIGAPDNTADPVGNITTINTDAANNGTSGQIIGYAIDPFNTIFEAILYWEISVNSPVVQVEPLQAQSLNELAAKNYQFNIGAFVDPDGDPVSFSASLSDDSALPAWIMFDAAQRLFTFNPPDGSAGNYSIKVTAASTVGNLTSASGLFSLVVSEVGVDNPPTWDAVPSVTQIGETSISVRATGNDDLATALTYYLAATSVGDTPSGDQIAANLQGDNSTPLLARSTATDVTVGAEVSLSLTNLDHSTDHQLFLAAFDGTNYTNYSIGVVRTTTPSVVDAINAFNFRDEGFVPMTDWLPYVLPFAEGVPELFVEQQTREALEEFCNFSRLWRQIVPAVDVSAGVAGYALDIPDNSMVVKAEEIYLGGIRLHPADDAIVARSAGGLAYARQNNKILLVPEPTVNRVAHLKAIFSLKPTASAVDCPRWIFDDWRQVIVDGILWRLLRMTGRTWADKDEAGIRMAGWHTGLNRAAADRRQLGDGKPYKAHNPYFRRGSGSHRSFH